MIANSGRVLGVVASVDTIDEARNIAYKNVDKINFEGKQYRADIGKIALG